MNGNERRRLAFQIVDGPNAGLASPGWRVWTHRDSIYMTAGTTGGQWKLSLHGDVAWRYGQTSEDQRSDNPVLPAGRDRAVWKFEPTPFENGVRRAFAIAVARHALLPMEMPRKESVVAVEDRWDRLTTLFFEVTLPGVDLQTRRAIVGDPLPLIDDRRLWLTAGSEQCNGEPERQAVGAMIEPALPDTHDVAFPGILVRGVHIG